MASRRQHAQRRRREAELHEQRQGRPDSAKPCRHAFILSKTCRHCREWLEARKEKGLGDKPYDIPY